MEGKKNTLQFLMASKWNAHKHYDQSYSFWITAFFFLPFHLLFSQHKSSAGNVVAYNPDAHVYLIQCHLSVQAYCSSI